MFEMLGEASANNANAIWSYVLIGVVVLLLIAMPIMMNRRNKRETTKIQEQTNSLKVGDKILTTSGVYGKITEIKFDDSKKCVVIETGGKTKSYMTIDAYAIYTVFKSDAEIARENAERLEKEQKTKAEEKPEEITETKPEEKKEDKTEAKKSRKKNTPKVEVVDENK